jgi:DNA helicase-4
VFIDEYQDFSELFHSLMQAVREQNPHANFFCVGDDWQAINGFAGSDLRFFQNFSQVFQDARELHVATNYRSAPAIVNVGNALMEGQGLGKRARAHQTMKGKVSIADLGTFEPTPQEKKVTPGDNFTPAVLRLVNKAVNDGKNVVLLSRKNRLPSITGGLKCFLKFLHSGLSTVLAEKVTISTVHKYKGLEQDVVIVLDAVPRCYPSLHPNLVFTQVFGDSIERTIAEERRLFYVALTRAVKELFILTEADNFSPFLEDLERNIELSRLEWLDYPPAQYIVIRVSNQAGRGTEPTMAIRGRLRAEGYRWYSSFESKFWYSIQPAGGFSVSKFIDRARWSKSADGIEVRFYGHLENQVARYHIDGGEWRCISGNIDNIPELPHDDIPF